MPEENRNPGDSVYVVTDSDKVKKCSVLVHDRDSVAVEDDNGNRGIVHENMVYSSRSSARIRSGALL